MRDLTQSVERVSPWLTLTVLLIVIPALYAGGVMDIVVLNKLGRFLALAIVALGIDLVWGYTGILTLCQAMFFCFGGYCIGMCLMHGPLDGDGIPRCLYVVSSEISGMKLPWFWKAFSSLPLALILGVVLPGLFATVFGYFAFRSRVRGVYFSIITQATTLGACLVFCRNETKLCGTNGLTNFGPLAGFDLTNPSVKVGLYLITVLRLPAPTLCAVISCVVRSAPAGRHPRQRKPSPVLRLPAGHAEGVCICRRRRDRRGGGTLIRRRTRSSRRPRCCRRNRS